MTGAEGDRSYPPAAVAWSGVALLFMVYASSFVDRQIMSLLVAPIRADLGISDTELSLLHGFAFALFYALVGIPIGQWVDRGDRRVILASGVAAWSFFTVLCGRTNSFLGLFLARVGVGVGEATVAPTTYSLLADYFPPERRGVPMGVFGSGVYVGVGVALIVGGLVVDALSQWRGACFAVIGCVSSWQLAFIIVGAPGLLLAGLVFLVYEPRRANLDEAGAQKRGRGLISYWRGGFSAIALHHAATVFLAMALYAVIAWSPEYLRRTFEIAPGRAGVDLGLIIAGAGMAGVIGWGALADVLLRRGAGAARVWTMAAAALIAAPAAYLFARAGSAGEAYVWFAVFIFGVSSLTNCGPVGVQELYPARLRGVGSAVFQFCVTLAGLGLGPTLVAAFSDFILKSDARLGDALAVTTPFMGLAAAFAAFGATRSYAETARRARDA